MGSQPFQHHSQGLDSHGCPAQSPLCKGFESPSPSSKKILFTLFPSQSFRSHTNKSHGKDINLTCYLITTSPYISGGGGHWNPQFMYLLMQTKAHLCLARKPGALETAIQSLSPGSDPYYSMTFVGFLRLSEHTLCFCRTGECLVLGAQWEQKRSHMKAPQKKRKEKKAPLKPLPLIPPKVRDPLSRDLFKEGLPGMVPL